MTILLFTTNDHKRKEFETLLQQYEPTLTIITPATLGLPLPHVEETGSTFAENAYIKALAMAYSTPYPILADDSGLSVKILDGHPGVRSARYAGENAPDSENRTLLIDNLKKLNVEESPAHFTAALAFIDGLRAFIVEAECHGKVIIQEHGKNGFGYDPLFIPDGYEQTFADCEPSVKNRVSHRAKALQKLINELKSYEYLPS